MDVCIQTVEPFERWTITNDYFRSQMIGNGHITVHSEWEPSLLEGWKEYGLKKVVALTGMLFIDQGCGRRYQLSGCTIQTPTGICLQYPEEFFFDGHELSCGDNDEVELVSLVSSWHHENLREAFKIYEMWIIERRDKNEVLRELIGYINKNRRRIGFTHDIEL